MSKYYLNFQRCQIYYRKATNVKFLFSSLNSSTILSSKSINLIVLTRVILPKIKNSPAKKRSFSTRSIRLTKPTNVFKIFPQRIPSFNLALRKVLSRGNRGLRRVSMLRGSGAYLLKFLISKLRCKKINIQFSSLPFYESGNTIFTRINF